MSRPRLGAANVLLVLLLSVLTTTCKASSTPSDQDARAAFIDSRPDLFSNGGAEVNSFRKANGVPGDIYEYDYEAAVTCLKPLTYFRPERTECDPGEQITVTGKLLFQRTENGWRAQED